MSRFWAARRVRRSVRKGSLRNGGCWCTCVWRANHEATGLLAAVFEGDRDALRRAGGQAIAVLRAERPGLLVEAASAGRWVAAQVLVELGFPSELPPGPSALHYAAGHGHVELVRSLVAAGANPDATDDKFNATPLGWAEFIGGRLDAPGNPQASGADWPAVIDFLHSQSQSFSADRRLVAT